MQKYVYSRQDPTCHFCRSACRSVALNSFIGAVVALMLRSRKILGVIHNGFASQLVKENIALRRTRAQKVRSSFLKIVRASYVLAGERDRRLQEANTGCQYHEAKVTGAGEGLQGMIES